MTSFRSLVAVLVLASIVGWGAPSSAQQTACSVKRTKIVGGAPAVVTNWPGQVALRLHSDASRLSWYFCGGTAITDKWVLTAAHCLHDHLTSFLAIFPDQTGGEREGRLEAVLEVDDLAMAPADR